MRGNGPHDSDRDRNQKVMGVYEIADAGFRAGRKATGRKCFVLFQRAVGRFRKDPVTSTNGGRPPASLSHVLRATLILRRWHSSRNRRQPANDAYAFLGQEVVGSPPRASCSPDLKAFSGLVPMHPALSASSLFSGFRTVAPGLCGLVRGLIHPEAMTIGAPANINVGGPHEGQSAHTLCR